MKSLVIWSGDREEKIRIKQAARKDGFKSIRCANPTYFDGVAVADAFVATGKIAEAYRAAGIAEYGAKPTTSKPADVVEEVKSLPSDWSELHYKQQIKLANERGADVETAVDARAFLEGLD
ncbi:MAG: hypothetical protein ACSHWQ_00035 [Spongiibacteraceae bacterium]